LSAQTLECGRFAFGIRSPSKIAIRVCELEMCGFGKLGVLFNCEHFAE
jgi:hypothetical protein